MFGLVYLTQQEQMELAEFRKKHSITWIRGERDDKQVLEEYYTQRARMITGNPDVKVKIIL